MIVATTISTANKRKKQISFSQKTKHNMIKQSFFDQLIYEVGNERTAILPSHGNDVSGLWHLIIHLPSARHSEITVAEQSLTKAQNGN